MKITKAQQAALTRLSELNRPSTSQQIGTQIKTMHALNAMGLVKAFDSINQPVTARECETILWDMI